MRILLAAFAVVMALGANAGWTAQQVSGTFTNGQTLFEECLVYVEFDNSDERPTLIQADQIAGCRRAVTMAADTVSVLSTVDETQPRFCLPTNIIVGTAVDVVIKWMKDNPSKRTFPAAVIVILAFQEAYPCGQ